MGAFNRGSGSGITPEQYANLTQDADLSASQVAVVSSVGSATTTITNAVQTATESINTQQDSNAGWLYSHVSDALNTITEKINLTASYLDGEIRTVAVNPLIPSDQLEAKYPNWVPVGGLGLSTLVGNPLSALTTQPSFTLCNVPSAIVTAPQIFRDDSNGLVFCPSVNATSTNASQQSFTSINVYNLGTGASSTVTVASSTATRYAGGGSVQESLFDFVKPGVFSKTNTTSNFLFGFGANATGLLSQAFKIDVLTGVKSSIAVNSAISVGFGGVLKLGDKVLFLGGLSSLANDSLTYGFPTATAVSVGTRDAWVYDAVSNSYSQLASNLPFRFFFNGRASQNTLVYLKQGIIAFVPAYFAAAADSTWTLNSSGLVFIYDLRDNSLTKTNIAIGSISEAGISSYFGTIGTTYDTSGWDSGFQSGIFITKFGKRVLLNKSTAVANWMGVVTDLAVNGASSISTLNGFGASAALTCMLVARVTSADGGTCSGFLRVTNGTGFIYSGVNAETGADEVGFDMKLQQNYIYRKPAA